MGNKISHYDEVNLLELEKIIKRVREKTAENDLTERNTTVGFFPATKDDEINVFIKNYDDPSKEITLDSARIKALNGKALESLRYDKALEKMRQVLWKKYPPKRHLD